MKSRQFKLCFISYFPFRAQLAFKFVPSREQFLSKFGEGPNLMTDLEAFVNGFSYILTDIHKFLVGGMECGSKSESRGGRMIWWAHHVKGSKVGSRVRYGSKSCLVVIRLLNEAVAIWGRGLLRSLSASVLRSGREVEQGQLTHRTGTTTCHNPVCCGLSLSLARSLYCCCCSV